MKKISNYKAQIQIILIAAIAVLMSLVTFILTGQCICMNVSRHIHDRSIKEENNGFLDIEFYGVLMGKVRYRSILYPSDYH